MHKTFLSARRQAVLAPGLAVAAVALTRFFCRSHYLYDVDSVHFALALKRFDTAALQPHPPGYFLYVMLGRLVNRLIGDPNSALVAISIAASCGAAALIWVLARDWYGRGAALVSLALFLVSPLCWFHGTVALVYIVEAFFSALLGYLCWKLYSGNEAFALPAALVLAVAAGFRPSTALLLGPLWILSLARSRWRVRLAAFAVLAGATLAWLVPMMALSGGAAAYFQTLAQLWSSVPGKRTALSNPALAIARPIVLCWVAVLSFGTALPLFFWRSGTPPAHSLDRTRFTLWWVLPGALFFSLVFFNYVNSGYVLVLSPPAFAFLGERAHRFLSAGSRRGLRWAAAAAAVLANCAFYAFAPYYCTLGSVRALEKELTALQAGFSSAINPRDTLIIGFDSHFLGYRHAGYYLPEYVTAQYPEVRYPDGNRVFVMHGRDTEVLRRLPDGFEHFVFFPLPEGADYAAYMDRVRALLPENALSTIEIGGRKALRGPARLLPLLFPSTAVRTVYTPPHKDR